jgi:hypothetical protein
MTTVRYQLVRSRLSGPPAHHEQLHQLLSAPLDYWKAQTPLPIRPVARVQVAPDGASFTEFQVADGITPGQLETLLVLMAARMPQAGIEFSVSGAGDIVGLRLVWGKLEAARLGAGGEAAWQALPHHSTLIGSK